MVRNNLVAAIIAAALAAPAAAGSAILSWEPPTENEDGSPLTDLAGYTVRWGCVRTADYPAEITILQPALRSFEVQNLPNTGTCYFTVQALNSGRVPRGTIPSRTSESSQYSNEASLVMSANPARVPYVRSAEGAAVPSSGPNPPPPLETLLAGRIVRAYVGDPVEFVVDATGSPTRHELRARFIQSGETIVTPFTTPSIRWTPPFAGLWYLSLRSCNTNGCGEWRSSVEDGQVWWFQLKAPTGGGIDP